MIAQGNALIFAQISSSLLQPAARRAIPAVAQGDRREPWDQGGPRVFLSRFPAPERGRRIRVPRARANATPAVRRAENRERENG